MGTVVESPKHKSSSIPYKGKSAGKEIEFSEEYLQSKTVDNYYGSDELAKSVIRSKYLHPIDKDNLALLWYREAKSLYDEQIRRYGKSKYTLVEFYEALEDFKYVFGGRIQYSIGVDGILGSLNNCYFHPIEHDSLYGIYHSLGTNALTYAKGGGVGNDITILRPANTAVKGTGATSPGSTSFMDIISCNTGTIAQHGRRGANLISIHCQHPDVEAFIENKNDNFFDYIQKIEKYDKNLARDLNNDFSDRRRTSFSNISIKFTDEFMNAVFAGTDVQLYFPDIDNCPEETDKGLIKKHQQRLVKYYMFYENLSVDEAQEKADSKKPYTIYDTRWDGDLDTWRANGYPIKIHKTVSAADIWDKFCTSAWRSAEPGLLYLDRIKENWTSDKPFRGVNPSLRAGTKVMTEFGIYPIEQLEGKDFRVPNLNGKLSPAECFLSSESAQLWEVTLHNGAKYYATAEHKWPVIEDEGVIYKKRTDELCEGDEFPLSIRDTISSGDYGDRDTGFLIGWILGDGWVSHRKSRATKKKETKPAQTVGLIVSHKDATYGVLKSLVRILKEKIGYSGNFHENPSTKDGGLPSYSFSTQNKALNTLLSESGFCKEKDSLPGKVWTGGSEEFIRGVVDGLFSSDGGASSGDRKRIYLTSSRISLLMEVQELLGFYGISSTIYSKEGVKPNFPNNKTYDRDYDSHELRITSPYSVQRFSKIFKLTHEDKQRRIQEYVYTRDYVKNNSAVVRNVVKTDLVEKVWDISVFDTTHCFQLAHSYTGNCGEILLSEYEPCCLGHVNLARFVDLATKRIDSARLKKYIPIFIYMQDLIHDVNEGRQALHNQEKESLNYRRIGSGYTALGDALIMMDMKYDDPQTIEYMESVVQEIEVLKWQASADIAAEKGPYPKFDYTIFSRSEHFKKMPENLRKQIKDTGIRNVATSTIAPVGTGSILTQTSSGIEPIFATHYKRRVKQEDGSYQTFYTYPKIVQEKFGSHKNLPDYVVTAHSVSYKDRVKMQGAFQRWIDNSISSTVNLSKDSTVQDVKDVYEQAFKSGLKGVSVYRDGSRAGVLITDDSDSNLQEGHAPKSPDRLPAIRVIRKFEGRKFYFTVTMNNGSPYEVFLSTNAHTSATNCDIAVEALEKLLRRHKIAQNLIDEQIEKSKHQANSVKVCRLVSMAMRHGIDLFKIVKTLVDLDMPVSTFIYHLGKVLSEWVPNGTPYDKESGWIFQNGCVINVVTGESKC